MDVDAGERLASHRSLELVLLLAHVRSMPQRACSCAEVRDNLTVVAGVNASEPPRTLGRYEVLGELARGGMATVHLAVVRAVGGFERTVAIKCCHPHLASDPEFVAMFHDEARIAAGIHHPNVIATLDAGSEGSVLYHVMEYVEGTRLADLVRAAWSSGVRIPVPVVVRIVIDMLHGLHAAHELRSSDGQPLEVVHRDVSPQNVMVGVDGVSRIMDFGIARAAARSAMTATGVVKGKFAYMAPEQLLGQEVDRRSDIFAAGVVLWEALASTRLFAADSHGETVQRVLHAPVAPPSTVNADAAPLDTIVLRALARSSDDRYATAADFAAELEASGAIVASPSAVAEHVRAVVGTNEAIDILTRRKATGSEEREPDPVADPIDTPLPRRSGGVRWVAPALALAITLLAGTLWAVLSADPIQTVETRRSVGVAQEAGASAEEAAEAIEPTEASHADRTVEPHDDGAHETGAAPPTVMTGADPSRREEPEVRARARRSRSQSMRQRRSDAEQADTREEYIPRAL